MNEKAKTDGLVLYRVTVQYATDDGDVRTQAYILEAKDDVSARKEAIEKSTAKGRRHPKISRCIRF